ncbi:hypothetical protein KGS77_24500 [Streptomyces sp. MST-110588]|nr:hypothetical protein KGS77_24500 [Streptomyces sp. MST-110588]
MPPPVRGGPARDRRWAAELRSAIRCAAGLLVLMLLVDLTAGTLSALRAACWTALALVLFGALFPARVTAGPGWLACRGLLRERRVRTDLLVLVHRSDGVAPRIVLRDALGGRVELDPKVLTANPLLWHQLDTGARHSRASGLLRSGAAPLTTLAQHVDRTGAREIFRASGLDCEGPGD